MTTGTADPGSSPQEVDSVGELIFTRAEDAPDHLAVQMVDASLTFGGLAELARRTAGALVARGVQPHDRVALLAGNRLELLGALGAGALGGAVAAPLNWHHRGPVLEYMVRHLDPALVVVDRDLVDEQQMDTVRAAANCEVVDRDEWVAEVAAASPHGGSRQQRGDVLAIVYTSGTTGRSKAAQLTHGLYLTEAKSFNAVVEPRSGDRYFTTLPLFHTNAQCLTLFGAVLAGLPAVVRDGFSASGLMAQIRDTDATVLNVLGAMVPMFLKRSPDYGPQGRLRTIVGGGIPEELVDECVNRFAVTFRRIYGLTETGLNAGEFSGASRGSVGRPFPHNHVRVAGEIGEIQLRPRDRDAFFRGYWRDADATRDVWTEDGWFRTGDLGRLDSDGFLHFAGRLKESIRRRGENISCAEVEMAVAGIPEVLDCAAVAVPSELAEDEVKLVYVLRPDAWIPWQQVWRECTERMAAFMVPRFYEQVELIPRTPTEKVERFKLTGLNPSVHDADGLAR